MLVPVYDILNCGKRHRYSANGKLVHNCQNLQLQNIPRDSLIKKGLVAPDEHVIVGLDLSNIELRVGLMFAGQLEQLNLLQSGKDLYKDFAAKAFDVDYDAVTKEQRFIGKASTLGLIYGVGAAKLRTVVKQGSGVDIGENEAQRIVTLYREEYTKVVELWAEGKNAIKAIASDAEVYMGYRKLLTVEGRRGIRLPSGLYVQYPNLRRVQGKDDKPSWVYDKSAEEVDKLYPAKVMQLCTQALARCVLGEAMVRIHKQYPIALTVHDAVYCVTHKNYAEDCLNVMMRELTTAPKWMPDIVLAAEGGYGKSLKDV